jgi:hypothetical protein
MKSPWIKKYYNDKRDFIVQEHEVYVPEKKFEFTPPEYDVNKQYEVALCQDTNEQTGQVSYLWMEESKQKIISPRFNTIEQAQYWMKYYEQK